MADFYISCLFINIIEYEKSLLPLNIDLRISSSLDDTVDYLLRHQILHSKTILNIQPHFVA